LHRAGDGCLFRHPAVEADDSRGYRNVATSLPRTRSGKSRRRRLKPVTLERELCDISAIDDEGRAPEAHAAGHTVRQARERRRKKEEEEVVAWQTWRCRIG
jgi:hypothetical protein